MQKILMLASFLSISAFAQTSPPPGIKVLSDSSQANWKGSTLNTDAKGLKFQVTQTHTQIEVAPHSSVRIEPASATESMELLSGMARARVEKTASGSDHPVKFLLRTKSATMGVRGTDFIAIANPVLGESEIIVFHGNVDFSSTSDATDLKRVTDGHWGGIGGRFGAKTHDLIALPKSALDYFDQVSQVK